MADNFFDTPTASPQTQQKSSGFFDTPITTAPEVGVSSPAALHAAGMDPVAPKSTGIFSTLGNALKTVATKIEGAVEGIAKTPIQTTVPKNNAATLTKTVAPQTNFFDAPVKAPSIPQAVASVKNTAKSLVSGAATGLSTLWENVKSDLTTPVNSSNATKTLQNAGIVPTPPAPSKYAGQTTIGEGDPNAQPANSLQDLLAHIGLPTTIVSNPITKTIGGAFDTAVDKTTSAIENITSDNKAITPSKKIGSGLDMATSLGNLLLSPITAAFGELQTSKVGKPIADIAAFPFQLIQKGVNYGVAHIMAALPISDDAKANLQQPISDALGLIAQIYAGDLAAEKGIPMVKEKIADIKNTVNQSVVFSMLANTDDPVQVTKILQQLHVPDEQIAEVKDPLTKAKTIAEVKDVLTGVNSEGGPKEAKVGDLTIKPSDINDVSENTAIQPKLADIEKIAEQFKPGRAFANIKDTSAGEQKYNTTLNPLDKDDAAYLTRIFSPDQVEKFKQGDFSHFRGEGKAYFEDIAKANIVPETPKTTSQKLEGRVKPYELTSDTLYHGTSADNLSEINSKGFAVGSSLGENAFRGGGYGAKQNSISFSTDPKIATAFTGSASQGGLIQTRLKPGSKVVTVDGIDYAEDLNDYVKDLRKQGVDAVYLPNEKEVAVINKNAIDKISDSRKFDVIKSKEQLADIYKKHAEATSEKTAPSEHQMNATAKVTAILDDIKNGHITAEEGHALIAKTIADAKALDEADKKANNSINGEPNTNIQQRSGDIEGGSGNAGGSILSISGRDRLDAERQLATGSAATGDAAELVKREGKELLNGGTVAVTENTHNVFRALGYGDEFSNTFNKLFQQGGIKTVSLEAFIDNGDGKRIEVNAAYSQVNDRGERVDLLQLNHASKDSELFQSGDILKHEISGHSWYARLAKADKIELFDNIKQDPTTVLEAWKKSGTLHAPYWEMTVAHMRDLVQSKGVSKDMAMEILKDGGIEVKDQTLEEFVAASLNIGENFDKINKQLETLGYAQIKSGPQNTIAFNEHVALIAETAKTTTSTNPVTQKYIDRVNENNLSFKLPDESRTLTPSTMAAVKDQFEGFKDLSTKILEKLKGRDTVSKQFIEDLTNSGDVKQVERDLIRKFLADEPDTVNVSDFANKVKAELLPLKRNDGDSYEQVNLPDNLRGDVEDYASHIYSSPVKTEAGKVHFDYGDAGVRNYFGHTRTEDIITGDEKQSDTRRVLEVQSDLYQKGRLETEYDNAPFSPIPNEAFQKTFQRESQKRQKEMNMLEQYNNPSAHFRMVREEIKQAALDGKSKLQFPTGETAMKIEGLGDNRQWYIFNEKSKSADINELWQDLNPDKLKVGALVQNGDSNSWVITDVLGDGKFKAIPRQVIEEQKKNPQAYPLGVETHAETFDISGKIDTNNPIYRFYEKDLGRYLKNNYNAKEVTDDKGVSWYEIPIDEEDANKPVLARIGGEKPSQDDLNALLKSSEDKAREDRQSDRLKELDTVVADSSNHDAFMRNLKKNTKLGELLPQLDKDVRDNGYQNLSDYYVKNKITSNVRDGVVPERQYAPAKEKAPEPVPEVKKINVSNKEAPMSEEDKQTLDNIRTQRALIQDLVDEHPGKKLTKFISRKEGVFEDFKDPMSTKNPRERKAIEERNKKIVDAAESAFDGTQYKDQFDNPDVIRAAIDDFRDLEAELENTKQTEKAFIEEERRVRNLTKDEIALEKQAKKNSVKEMPTSISEVRPPEVRGGLTAPHLNLEKWKDKGMAALNRDTFERNLEKVAPQEDADALKKFIVDPVRANETARIKFNNELKTRTLEKMKKFGISRNTLNDELIQKFGEGEISLTELQKLAPKKWGEIQQAADYFRKIYDQLLDQWNEVRKEYGYAVIPKRPDYFRHFDEVNFFTKTYGLLSSKNELPTSIAGKTEFFKPGKPFSTAEMHRTGNSTKYSAIGGFNNYIESVSKQIYHINSIQRGRALERYLENAAKVGETLGTPLRLPNVIANIREYVNNGLAGKTATLDRALESTLGRPTIAAFQSLSKLIGKNIIVGNLSTALSHLVSLPLIGATTDKIPLMKGMMTTLTSPLSKGGFATVDGIQSDFLTRRFPIEEIMPTAPKKIETALSYLFTATDKFKSRVAVAGKYYEGIGNGLSKEEAMRQADIYGGKVIGDYSLGQKPNLMNAKTMTLLAQFQLGLNDSISVLTHDIPYQDRTYTTDEKTGETKSKANKWKVTSKLIQFAIFSYLFNQLLKQIRGSGKGLDPIDTGLTLAGLNQEGQGQTFGQRAGLAIKDVSGELPFTSLFTGNFPLASAFSTPIGYLKSGNYKKAAESLAIDFASPVGGGAQAQKTILAVESIKAGETTTKAQEAQALIFGPKATIANNKISVNLSKSLKAEQTRISKYDQAEVDIVKPVFDQAKAAGFGTPEADAIVTNLTDSQYKIYKSLKAADADQNAIDQESKILPIVTKANSLGFGSPAADKLIADSFPDTPEGNAEYEAYTKIKTSLYGAGANTAASAAGTPDTEVSHGTPGPGTSTYDKQSFLTHIFNGAKALGTDPMTFFNDVFSGDYKITGLANGQIIVNRNTQKEASERKALGGGNTVTLDHVKSLELGGTNQTSNMWLVDKTQAAVDDQIENYLADALNSGKITGKQAQEYELRYKKGADAAFIDSRTKKFFDGVGDPMTFDQVKQAISSQ